MSRFKTCESLVCDNIAKKVVKIYLEDDESQIGGWDADKTKPENMFETGRGMAVLKKKKSHKVRVCLGHYNNPDIEDFSPFFDYYGVERKISRIVRL